MVDVPELLTRFPEVRWDRVAKNDDGGAVYGWIRRPNDDRFDFLVLQWREVDAAVWFVTSSSLLSAEFHRRLFGDSDELPHVICERVVDVYGPKDDAFLTPLEWCRHLGLTILDPDGWRGAGGRPFEDPIDRAEFHRRFAASTVSPHRRPPGTNEDAT